MYRQNKIVALVTFFFFALLFFTGRSFEGVASYMPVFVGSLGMACSTLLYFGVWIKEKNRRIMESAKAYPRREALQLMGAFLLISLYCVLIKPVGFVITSFLFFFLFSLCYGKKEKILLYLAVSAAAVAVIYFGFGLTLHTSFPQGILI